MLAFNLKYASTFPNDVTLIARKKKFRIMHVERRDTKPELQIQQEISNRLNRFLLIRF